MKLLKVGVLVGGLILSSLSLTNITQAAENDHPDKSFIQNLSEDVAPQEVKNVLLSEFNSNRIGNAKDGYSSGDIRPMADTVLMHKDNNQWFGVDNGAGSVISVNQEYPGFWQNLYQNKYDGYGYKAYLKGSYKPTNASATAYVTATGAVTSISLNNTTWALVSGTKNLGSDSTSYKSGEKQYAQANFPNVRIQNVSTLTSKFEVKSTVSFSNAGASTVYTSVRF